MLIQVVAGLGIVQTELVHVPLRIVDVVVDCDVFVNIKSNHVTVPQNVLKMSRAFVVESDLVSYPFTPTPTLVVRGLILQERTPRWIDLCHVPNLVPKIITDFAPVLPSLQDRFGRSFGRLIVEKYDVP